MAEIETYMLFFDNCEDVEQFANPVAIILEKLPAINAVKVMMADTDEQNLIESSREIVKLFKAI